MQIFNLTHALLIKIYILCINYQISVNINYINKKTSSINNISTFQSKKNISLIYDKTGKLQCKLITQYIEYSDNTKTIYLIQPSAILFNNKVPIWNIKAQKAEITHDKIMHLHGNVQIINLIQHSYLKFITTNTATLNLITYDIFSNEKTTIHGIRFQIIATNMESNLKRKFTRLSKKVYTLYEIQNSKKI